MSEIPKRFILIDGQPADTSDDSPRVLSSEETVRALNAISARLDACRGQRDHSMDERLLARSRTRYVCRQTDVGPRWIDADADDPEPIGNLQLHDLLETET